MAHGGRARGEMGGGTREQCGSNKKVHWFPVLGSLKNLTTGLIWLVTTGGMGGGVAHGGRARGEMGGGNREQCGSNKSALVPSFGNLTTGLIWLVTRVGGGGEAWGGGPWRAAIKGDPFQLPSKRSCLFGW